MIDPAAEGRRPHHRSRPRPAGRDARAGRGHPCFARGRPRAGRGRDEDLLAASPPEQTPPRPHSMRPRRHRLLVRRSHAAHARSASARAARRARAAAALLIPIARTAGACASLAIRCTRSRFEKRSRRRPARVCHRGRRPRGGQLHERAARDERHEQLGPLLHLRVALRVREHRNDPERAQPVEPLRQLEWPAAVGRLDQQVVAGCRRARIAATRPPGGRARRSRAPRRRRAARCHPPRPAARERVLHLLGRRRVVVAHVRSAGEHLDAVRRRCAADLDCLLDVLRPVVEARQHVAVEVDQARETRGRARVPPRCRAGRSRRRGARSASGCCESGRPKPVITVGMPLSASAGTIGSVPPRADQRGPHAEHPLERVEPELDRLRVGRDEAGRRRRPELDLERRRPAGAASRSSRSTTGAISSTRLARREADRDVRDRLDRQHRLLQHAASRSRCRSRRSRARRTCGR